MQKLLKRAGKILLLVIFLTVLALGIAWLSADRWSEELARPASAEAGLADIGWPRYGNDQGGSRFSMAGQVNRDTLSHLAPVWTFRTGETGEGYRSGYKHSFQATPVLAGNTLYFSTAFNRVFAIDAQVDPDTNFSEVSNRGVVYWADQAAPPGKPCRERIFVGTLDARLIALDADTGKRCTDFADNGETDLKAALRDEDRGVARPQRRTTLEVACHST